MRFSPEGFASAAASSGTAADAPAARSAAMASAWVPADLLDHPAPEVSDEEAADDARERAFQEGVAAGRAQGAHAERERLRTCLRALDEAVEEFSRSSADWTAALEENIAALAVATARHILDGELATDAHATRRIVARALAEFSVDEPVQVRLNPTDLAILQSLLASEDAPSLATQGRCRWVADQNIVAGGCIVEGRERIADGRVDLALERVYRRLVRQHA
jgi:flagellar biosynthesis/type III secretory pathway protein FliH